MSEVTEAAQREAYSEWAQAKRAEGALIIVQSLTGRIHHADDGFAALIKRQALTDNGFDMITPESAAEGARKLGENAGRPTRSRFPWLSDSSGLVWCRFETIWPKPFMVHAVWKEEDPAQHKISYEFLDE